jgi:2',3'-cyclic-nucleotide 2'-phosphodiesterase (5'-nucleotidase family)
MLKKGQDMKRLYICAAACVMVALLSSPPSVYAQTGRKTAARNVRHHYEVTDVRGTMIPVDSTYDAQPDKKGTELVAHYKQGIKALMTTTIGTCAQNMTGMGRKDAESLLSNLASDVLREAGTKVMGKTCDMGLVNKGGLRATLPKGPITIGNIYEIMPFDNSLCVVMLSGQQLMTLFEEIAKTRGQGISGAKMVITHDGRLIDATIGGEKVDMNRTYSLATLNYLAEGNDGMNILGNPEVKHTNYDNMIIRDIMIDYVKARTAKGEVVQSSLDGRCSFQQ